MDVCFIDKGNANKFLNIPFIPSSIKTSYIHKKCAVNLNFVKIK